MSVRWGFIGAGYVASRAMAPAVHGTASAELYAVASRDPRRSAQLEPKVVHESYRDLINDPEVAVVYISLTNVQHKEWVIAALDAGKHVLCEKPLGLNAAEVRDMMDAAAGNDCLLVEAVWTRWQPRMRRMAEIVRRGTLGEVRGISSAFTFQGDLDGNYRSDPTMGGGALLDVGCYQTHLWLMLLGESVDVAIENVDITVGPTGIDTTTSVQAVLNGTVAADSLSSFDLSPRQRILVEGADATMSTGIGEAFTLWKQESTLVVGDTIETFAADDAFALMIQDVSAAVRGEASTIFPGESSWRVADTLDAVRRYAV